MPRSGRYRCAEKIAALFETCRLRRWIRHAALLAIVALCACNTQATTPPNWKETGFSINANGMTLTKVIAQFGSTYGVRIAMNIPGNAAVHGRLQASGGAEFLDRLAASYGFRWFVYNDTLHIVPLSDFISVRLEVGEDTVPDAKPALIGLGLLEARFGWGELPDEGVVFVGGPREYVNLVKGVLLPDGKKAEHQERQLMVFRLKYASAADRVVTTRGQQEVTPGVKTILSGILDAEPATRNGGNSVLASTHNHSRDSKLGLGGARESISSTDREQRTQTDDAAQDEIGRRRKTKNQGVRIDADPSLNAILIYDFDNKRAIYQTLIAELDIEPQQVEIEALIVNIDRSKLSQLGAEWGAPPDSAREMAVGATGDAPGIDQSLPGSTLLIRDTSSFYDRLSVLEEQGNAQVLARPTVLTLENIAAVLDLSQTRYVPLVGERVADLANITAGTMLKVVPRVIREDSGIRIRLDIDIEDGDLNLQTQSVNTQSTRSTITTQAIVEPQHTLLIGGYHSESSTRSSQKTPAQENLPFSGTLLQNRSSNVSNRERLFLITPRLVGHGGVLAPSRAHSDVAPGNRQTPLADLAH